MKIGVDTLDVVRFCAAECERQQSGEMSVAWMFEAYEQLAWMLNPETYIYADDVAALFSIVEPEKCKTGFRTTPVHFADLSMGIDAELIWNSMAQLLDAWGSASHPDRIDNAEFYQRLMEIHPGSDGNGRVGALLFNRDNIINGRSLEVPPRFKKSW